MYWKYQTKKPKHKTNYPHIYKLCKQLIVWVFLIFEDKLKGDEIYSLLTADLYPPVPCPNNISFLIQLIAVFQ